MSKEMSEPFKQVIVIRKDVPMSLGKIVAQAVHAAQCVEYAGNVRYDYHSGPGIKTIVTYVKSEDDMVGLCADCEAEGVPWGAQQDRGLNEIEAGTLTALSIGPAEESRINPITKRLQTVKLDIGWGEEDDRK